MRARNLTFGFRRVREHSGAGGGVAEEGGVTTAFDLAARFDADWYVATYARGEAVRGALRHFREVGAGRGFRPNPIFSEAFYRGQYQDVSGAVEAGAYPTGFDHYVVVGRHEGRLPTALRVMEDWYRARYPDVDRRVEAGEFQSGLDHYLLEGAALRLCPHEAFDEEWYLRRYPNVLSSVLSGAYLSGYQHFLERGLAAGFGPHPDYSDKRYLALNPEVAEAVENDEIQHPYLHLIENGLAEGREWRRESAEDKVRRAATELALLRLEQFMAADRKLCLPRAAAPDVSILLVLFNRAELTLRCLESILQLEDVSYEVVMVDNDSQDGTREMLLQVAGTTVILNEDNVGFVRASNQAASAAKGRYLLFLNNDTEIWPASLRSAIDCLEGGDNVGAVGGRVINLDGRLQEAGSIVWSDGTTDGYGRGDDPSIGSYRFRREVDYCSGSFLLTPRELFRDLDGFDEVFAPAYYEEADYCFRLRRRGLKVVYDPQSILLHHECASLKHPSEVNRFLARNRPVFVDRHQEAIAGAQRKEARNAFLASDRRDHRGRILIVEDRIPLRRQGAGSPRMQEILHNLCDLGYFVTLFATDPRPVDWVEVRREMPFDRLELINHMSRREFASFWDGRRTSYDVVIISRPHNMKELVQSGFDPSKDSVRLIYDAEAIAARRQLQRRAVLPGAPQVEGDLGLEEELALARAADEIWAVSEEEGRMLAAPGQPWSVVSFGTLGEPGNRRFEERQGLLFIGRLVEEWNPNVDALRWYITEIHPRVREELGEGAGLTVVGQAGEFDLPAVDGVEFLGNAEDLAPLYDAHRVFIAPTRFAAGIPHKVTSAAAHGIPVVVTSLLSSQLGWTDGVEIADGGDNDAHRFADQVVRVYRDRDLWQTLRSNALERAARQFGPDVMRESLKQALQP